MKINDFESWLVTCQKSTGGLLSSTTAKHYSQGLRTTSDDMITKNVITKRLEDMELYELDVAIFKIFNNAYFKSKNKKGNNMYSNAVKRFRTFIYLNTERGKAEIKEEQKILSNPNIAITEKEAIIKARIGQGIFKKNLITKYGGKCVVTGLKIKQALIASHIKPWAVCDNTERVDVNNGILLSATFDRLFDSGLISFKDNGQILISDLVSNEDINILNIKNKDKFEIKYNANMHKYIEYHNQYIFIGRA